jgi:cyclopropane fatty-acyl-phospholipid synthase-like methyltransferase
MRILRSNYLNDGKLFNDGRPVDLIKIEKEEDYDTLLNNIIRSGYYDLSYFGSHIDYREGEVKFDSFYLSSILKFLKPKSLLEFGCGRGDVLFLLGLDHSIKVRGIEFSQDVLKKVWPSLTGKVDYGDILEVCKTFLSRNITFDTFCAFDLWEHLLPGKLPDYIDSFVALAEKDALFFFTIPAYGEDRVFGELFPLEFEENREKFKARTPFDYLIVESMEPAIPVKGHLICAHTQWWQKQFERHGLVRAEELERNIHAYFDEHFFYARKSLYIFYLNSPEAQQRVSRLLKNGLTLFKKWKLLVEQQEVIMRSENDPRKSFIDRDELKSTINHAEFYMILDMKKRLERWTGKPLRQKKIGLLVRPFLSRIEKWANEYFDDYIRRFKQRHYFV